MCVLIWYGVCAADKTSAGRDNPAAPLPFAAFASLALGDFDVYMSISTKEGEREQRAGDLSACASLTPRRPPRQRRYFAR